MEVKTAREKIEMTVESMWFDLPNVAREVIREFLIDNRPQQDENFTEENKEFLANPDSSKMHETKWHEWGIITHSKMFEKYYQELLPKYFEKWGFSGIIKEQMGQKIDGIEKEKLLRLSIIWHDIGKFGARKLKLMPDGKVDHSFKGHEKLSGEIVREKLREKFSFQYRLSDNQIEYIARCAELHFELGKVRDSAKKSPNGFTIKFVDSPEFDTCASEVMEKYPDFALEIAMLYLADSLGKVEVHIDAESDEDVESQKDRVKETVKILGLPESLILGIIQMPTNIYTVKKYLNLYFNPPKADKK